MSRNVVRKFAPRAAFVATSAASFVDRLVLQSMTQANDPRWNTERVVPANSISVIVPALNEESVLASTLESIRACHPLEVILVDGGSIDGTQKVASSYGAKILFSAPGRAEQMNCGAAAASGSVLLFLHADTRLPPQFDHLVWEALARPGVVAGAFELRIDAPARSLRWIERLANWRSRRLHLPYGDQAIFVRAELFHSIGGFPELPIMEDFELMRRLRRSGRIEVVREPVRTSARRWVEAGILRTTLANQLAIVAYLMGTEPARIACWYHRYRKHGSLNGSSSEARAETPSL